MFQASSFTASETSSNPFILSSRCHTGVPRILHHKLVALSSNFCFLNYFYFDQQLIIGLSAKALHPQYEPPPRPTILHYLLQSFSYDFLLIINKSSQVCLFEFHTWQTKETILIPLKNIYLKACTC